MNICINIHTTKLTLLKYYLTDVAVTTTSGIFTSIHTLKSYIVSMNINIQFSYYKIHTLVV